MTKLKELKENFFDCCYKYSGVEFLLDLIEDIEGLKPKTREKMLSQGFTIACINGNEETLEALLFHPSFKINYNADFIAGGLMVGIDHNSVDTLKYLLVEAPLSIKENQTQGGEYIKLCYGALCYAMAYPKNGNHECVRFLIDYLHEYTFEQYNEPIHILKEDKGNCFQIAWQHNNWEALKIFIEIYGINGQEPELKQFLNKNNNTKLQNEDVIRTMIRSNHEKPMLEELISTNPNIESNKGIIHTSGERAIHTKVVKNERKHKI